MTLKRCSFLVVLLSAHCSWLFAGDSFSTAPILRVQSEDGNKIKIFIFIPPEDRCDLHWGIYVDTASGENTIAEGPVGDKGVAKVISHRLSGSGNHFVFLLVKDHQGRIIKVHDEQLTPKVESVSRSIFKYVELIIGACLGFFFTCSGMFYQEKMKNRKERMTALSAACGLLLSAVNALLENWNSEQYTLSSEYERTFYTLFIQAGNQSELLGLHTIFRTTYQLWQIGRATEGDRHKLEEIRETVMHICP